jgi:AbrB family looped-hinge helix DNA binding protein
MTRKGQVTIPKPIRDLLGLKPGSAVDFKVTEEGQVLLLPAKSKKSASRFALLRGSAGENTSPESSGRFSRSAAVSRAADSGPRRASVRPILGPKRS